MILIEMFLALETLPSPTVMPPDHSAQCCTKLLLDDPPFYLNRSPSDIASACAVPPDQSFGGRHEPVLPTRPMPLRMGSSEGTSEEFRGVIDDLTVKNKKLRQKLKKYENLHSSHLQEEKLFEVRVHGLPPHKKRELEQTLRSFASSLDEPSDIPAFLSAPLQASDRLVLLPSKKTPSSSTSYSKPIDSAYASISASGQTMNSQSARNDTKRTERHIQFADLKQQNLKSYLRDIPQQLLPTKSPFITEKVKRKMVVRRLEQIFTGKGAATKGYNVSLQPQGLSQLAARADRRPGEAGGSPVEMDGVREARILPPDSEFPEDIPVDSHSMVPGRDHNDGDDLKYRDTTTVSGGETPDQRPTRLLDLHMYHTQVPAENMQYIRHLRLASPTMNSEETPDNWIYLNLLASMAQLHTLNVTTEFVRKAVADVSTKFELSSDGRKLRWRGDAEGTRMSPDSESSVRHRRRASSDLDHFPRKRRRTEENSLSKPGAEVQSGAYPVSNSVSSADSRAEDDNLSISIEKEGEKSNGATKFHYKPLFFRGLKPKADDESDVHDDHSVSSSDPGDETTTLYPGGRECGPIIFYKEAKFCTDLSGDPDSALVDNITYTRLTDEPLGCEMLGSNRHLGFEGKRSLFIEEQARSESVKVGSGISSSTGSPLTMRAYEPLNDDKGYDNTAPMYLEASGLGGVQPQDNFAIHVQVQHGGNKRGSAMSGFSKPHGRVHRVLHKIPRQKDAIGEIDSSTSAEITGRLVEPKIISIRTTMLPPSTLPDPSYLCLPFSENEDDDDDDHNNKINYHQQHNKNEEDIQSKSMSIPSWQDEASDEGADFLFTRLDEDSDETSIGTTQEKSDDSSIDLLAHARVLDPDTIAAREREFDSNVGQPLAEVHAGSSAATAGGGSGFDSESSSSSESELMERMG